MTLYLSRNTVKSYQKSIYAKLGVHSKQEIIELVVPSLRVGSSADERSPRSLIPLLFSKRRFPR